MQSSGRAIIGAKCARGSLVVERKEEGLEVLKLAPQTTKRQGAQGGGGGGGADCARGALNAPLDFQQLILPELPSVSTN